MTQDKEGFLMRVGVVGINHKLADLRLRELLAKSCRRRFGSECSCHFPHYFILLSTCNRTEIYFSSEDLAQTHTYLLSILREEVCEEFDQKLYSYFGYDCFLHLSRVTAGLDSAIIAETEIQGQVKAAYEHAAGFRALPEELHFLFQKSLKIGKDVRTSIPMKPGLPNLEHAILNSGADLFTHPDQAKVLFVGASEINKKILGFLKSKKINSITICNRTLQTAQAIAETFSVKQMPWAKMNSWHEFDWIIFGTKAPNYLITQQMVPSKLVSHKLVVDLSVPRNVEPTLNLHPEITLLNIDQLNDSLKIRKKKMTHTLIQAEQNILECSKRQIERFYQKEKAREQFLAIGASVG